MCPYFSKDTSWIDDSSEVNPRDEHSDEEEDHKEGVGVLGLHIPSSS